MALTFSELPMVKPFLEPTKPKYPVRVSLLFARKPQVIDPAEKLMP
jgi:hypothetical protein